MSIEHTKRKAEPRHGERRGRRRDRDTSGRVERGEARGKGRPWETDISKMNSTTSRTVCITTNCGKFFKRWEYQTTLPAF